MRTSAAFLFFILPCIAQEQVDLKTIDQIKAEAIDRSKVKDHLYQLTEVHGPRLTGSPEFEDAAKWAVEQLKQYGLQYVHTEMW